MARHSQTLFNFMKEREYLTGALEKGSFWPRYNSESAGWMLTSARSPGSMALPMVCFCDIPLQRIDSHLARYGEFGLGMTRSWGVASGLNPVFYVSANSPVRSTFTHLHRTTDLNVLKAGRELLAYAKDLSYGAISSGSPNPQDVYGESEWRYVPPGQPAEFPPPPNVPAHIRDAEFAAAIAKANAETDLDCRLPFDLADVRYVFVPDETHIPWMVDFIMSSPKLAHHGPAALQVLTTRITPLDMVRGDY